MVKLLRILQISVFLLVLPMIALGGMSLFSGGGMTPAFQDIGAWFVSLSIYVPIPSIIVSEIVYRLMKHTKLPDIYMIPVLIAATPIMMWVGLIIWLELETGFITG